MNSLDCARRCAATMLASDRTSKAMGIEIHVPAAGTAIATMTVRDDMVNGFDVCHGGLVFTLADTAFAFACNAYNDQTLSVEADINWRRKARSGDVLEATATEQKRTGRHGYYRVLVCNQDDELVAEFNGHSVALGEPLLDV